MHAFEMPRAEVDRVLARQGRAHSCESLDASTTALVVVDMQNYFLAPPYEAACPVAQEIVPDINRLASALRRAGGTVVWIQNHAPRESEQTWSVNRERYRPQGATARWDALQSGAHGFALWPQLDVQAVDLRVLKQRYSAFTQGSSDLDRLLRNIGVRTLLVTGVATNVCCDATARDAMMLNYHTVMVSDACAAASDAEHAACLVNFYLYFGDVQSTEQIVSLLA